MGNSKQTLGSLWILTYLEKWIYTSIQGWCKVVWNLQECQHGIKVIKRVYENDWDAVNIDEMHMGFMLRKGTINANNSFQSNR